MNPPSKHVQKIDFKNFLSSIQKNHIYWTILLVQSLSRTHRTFDVQRTDVLPVLLKKGHQKVNGQMDVLNQLVFIHANMSNSNAQAQNLKWKENKNLRKLLFPTTTRQFVMVIILDRALVSRGQSPRPTFLELTK